MRPPCESVCARAGCHARAHLADPERRRSTSMSGVFSSTGCQLVPAGREAALAPKRDATLPCAVSCGDNTRGWYACAVRQAAGGCALCGGGGGAKKAWGMTSSEILNLFILPLHKFRHACVHKPPA
eukprot:6175749-Pleurochrysis_carterae.AAC.3